jgi:hypothetical protein
MDRGSAHRKASTYTRKNTNTKERTQTPISQVAFEFVKTVHALDSTTTMIGWIDRYVNLLLFMNFKYRLFICLWISIYLFIYDMFNYALSSWK